MVYLAINGSKKTYLLGEHIDYTRPSCEFRRCIYIKTGENVECPRFLFKK